MGADRVEVVRTDGGRWRWRIVGGKTYRSRFEARRAGLEARSAGRDGSGERETREEVREEVRARDGRG